MIAPFRTTKPHYTQKEIEIKFLELLPTITNNAKAAFRDYSYDWRDDSVLRDWN